MARRQRCGFIGASLAITRLVTTRLVTTRLVTQLRNETSTDARLPLPVGRRKDAAQGEVIALRTGLGAAAPHLTNAAAIASARDSAGHVGRSQGR